MTIVAHYLLWSVAFAGRGKNACTYTRSQCEEVYCFESEEPLTFESLTNTVHFENLGRKDYVDVCVLSGATPSDVLWILTMSMAAYGYCLPPSETDSIYQQTRDCKGYISVAPADLDGCNGPFRGGWSQSRRRLQIWIGSIEKPENP
jgi:hypothetical protein